jgi:hypothetical protein
VDFVTYLARKGWKSASQHVVGLSGFPPGQAEQARLAVASDGGALGYRAAILLQFEQGGLLDSCYCCQLLAPPLQKLAPDETLAVDVDEFRCGQSSPPPLPGVSAALRCTPARRRDRG